MDSRQKTGEFLSLLDEDLLMYEDELKKRGFTSSATLKYVREHDLEEIGMADGHKRLLMNAVSKLQSPQQNQLKDCSSFATRKRQIPCGLANRSELSDSNSEDELERDSTQKIRGNLTSIETPVQRFLRHKRNEIGKLQCDLEEKQINLNKTLSALQNAEKENAVKSSISSCGQCHLRLGHTRRNCTLSPCKSVYSCGMIDKHPNDKKKIKALEHESVQIQQKIQKLQSEHDSYVKAKNLAERSKSKMIEDNLLSECPSRYVNVNGSKNWMLLNKDVAILEKNLNVRETGLPNRKSMLTLLRNETRNFSMAARPQKSYDNPKRRLLEDHGIKFPTSSTAASSTSTLTGENAELDDFTLAVSLQNKECQEFKEESEKYQAASSLMGLLAASSASKDAI